MLSNASLWIAKEDYVATVIDGPSRPNDGLRVSNENPERRSIRFLQSLGAILVTIAIFVLLFGVPARLLFGIFFD